MGATFGEPNLQEVLVALEEARELVALDDADCSLHLVALQPLEKFVGWQSRLVPEQIVDVDGAPHQTIHALGLRLQILVEDVLRCSEAVRFPFL